MTIGITGASGQLGMGLLRHAMGRTDAANIVAITRNPAKLEEFAKQGIQVREGDFNEASGLEKALKGVEKLMLIPTSDLSPGVRSKHQAAAIDAAKDAGVKHVIYISTVSPRPDENNALLDSHFRTEQHLIGSGLEWTILRMSIYADSQLDAAKRAVASGTYSAIPGAPAAYVVREDLAAAAAGLLTTPGHVGLTYHATGPQSLGQQEVCAAISKAAGKQVQFAEMTEAQQRQGLQAAGLPPFLVTGIIGFGAALRAGAFDLVTGDIQRLSGKAPESLESFFKRMLAA